MDEETEKTVNNLERAVKEYVGLVDDLVIVLRSKLEEISTRAVDDEPGTAEDRGALDLIGELTKLISARQGRAREALRGDS